MNREPRRLAGAGEPLVLLHGLGHSWRAWSPLLDELERRHEVLALDLPGFGEAPPLPSHDTAIVPALADAVEREMDTAGFDTAHVAGNSLGGWLALELARRGRARSVVAISPAGAGTRRENAYARSLFKVIRAATQAGAPIAGPIARPRVTRALFFWPFFSRPGRLDPGQATYHLRAFARAPGFHPVCDWIFSNRAHPVDAVSCPVTLAWGSRDLVLLPRQAARFLRQLPEARFVRLEGLGHVPMSDDPALLTQLILTGTAASVPLPPPPARAPGRGSGPQPARRP